MNESDMTDEQRIEAALAQLQQPSNPPNFLPDPLTLPADGPSLTRGPTLEALGEVRHPKPSTVCETCPMSLWLATEWDLKCYCRLMHTLSWDSTEPRPLTHCDGPYLPSG